MASPIFVGVRLMAVAFRSWLGFFIAWHGAESIGNRVKAGQPHFH